MNSERAPQLSETAPVPRGRLGGIDYGSVRVGLATCDPSQTWVTPYETYTRRNPRLDESYFCELKRREGLVGWVIGLPIHCDGKESQKSQEVRAFADWISSVTLLPHWLYDERFTTREARRLLQETALSSSKKKQRLDTLAAHLILSHFLDASSSRLDLGSKNSLDDA